MVPDPGIVKRFNPRTKLRAEPKVNNRAAAWVQKIRRASFFVTGPKLYNTLPENLRELEDTTKTKHQNILIFKRRLDKYLETIIDLPGQANSLLHHVQEKAC